MLLLVFIGMTDANAETYKEICLGDNFVLTYVTPTVQTVALRSPVPSGKTRLLRGKIEFMAVGDSFVAGYLSTRFFEEDELVGLAGTDDREGFFIVSKADAAVISGMTGDSFFHGMKQITVRS